MSLVQSTELRFSRRLGSSCEVKIEGIARLSRAELHSVVVAFLSQMWIMDTELLLAKTSSAAAPGDPLLHHLCAEYS